MQLITIPDFEASGGFSQEFTQDSSIMASQAGTAENFSSHLDEITVLVAQSGFAAKTLSRAPTGEVVTKSHSAGKMFRFLTYRISDILELGALLDVIQENRRLLVIRGEPAKALTPENPVQRLKKDFKTPARGRRWVMIDFDKIALPAGLGLHVDKSQAIEHVVHLLPQEFHGVTYYWQLSSKAGFTSNDTISLHVWFWLDRPVPDEDLKAWSKALNEEAGFKLIDTFLFNDVQQHYTSRPILKGLDDPFPVRSGPRWPPKFPHLWPPQTPPPEVIGDGV